VHTGSNDVANNYSVNPAQDTNGGIIGRDVHAKVLLNTEWGQRGVFAMYAPWKMERTSKSKGCHWPLGSETTAIAQITYFHRLCPSGFVNYTAPGFAPTEMNFMRVIGLCDWSNFAKSPKKKAKDRHTAAVAKYEYAIALILQKKWGTDDYMITDEKSSVEVESHLGVKVLKQSMSETTLLAMHRHIVRELNQLRPLKMFMNGERHGHHVVVDGYRTKHRKFLYHLNVGHSGYDDGWYEFGAPICLRHYSNGKTASDGVCAYYYDDINNFEFWSISVRKRSDSF